MRIGQLEDIESELGIGAPPSSSRDIKMLADYTSGKLRVLPLPFDKQTLTANGATTLTATADRACKPVRVIIDLFHSVGVAANTVVGWVTGIHVQGINQLLGTGFVPCSTFLNDTPNEDLPFDFAVLATGGTMLLNITVAGLGAEESVYVSAMAKCISTQ